MNPFVDDKPWALFEPGPWHMEECGDNPEWITVFSGDVEIAHVICPEDESGDPKVEADRCWANASLIAAAPEMLSELDSMRSMLMQLHRYGTPIGGFGATAFLSIANQLGELIDKAKGKTSVLGLQQENLK